MRQQLFENFLGNESAESLKLKGNSAMQQGDVAFAEKCFRQAIARDPAYMPAHYNLGNVLRVQRHDREALSCYQRANELAPGDFDILINLGVVLNALGRYPEAISAFDAAARISPGRMEAQVNKAVALGRAGLHDEAVAIYDALLIADPGNANIRYFRSLEYLALERWQEGFRDFEARLAQSGALPHDLLQGKPVWDGAELKGKTLLILPERGVGDMIQFLRYASLCKAQGARVMVCCHPVLASLLAAAPDIDRVVPDGARLPESFDTYVSVMSLPALLGRMPGLAPLRLNFQGQPSPEIAAAKGLKVGVCWRRETGDFSDAEHSIPDEQFWAALQGLGDVSLFSFQMGDTQDRLATPLWSRITDCLDEAVLVQQLDLMVTVDNSLAHLSGTIGVPTCLLVSHSADWRWGVSAASSAWYPGTSIFRQAASGDWSEALDNVRTAIGKFHLAR